MRGYPAKTALRRNLHILRARQRPTRAIAFADQVHHVRGGDVARAARAAVAGFVMGLIGSVWLIVALVLGLFGLLLAAAGLAAAAEALNAAP
jgi:hypothetical protein